MLILVKYTFCVKIGYVTPIQAPGLSFKEKPLIHDRGRNFYLIVTKFGTQVGLVKIQVEFEDELCRSYRGF